MLGWVSANREHLNNILLTRSYGISNRIFQLPRIFDYGRHVIKFVTVILYQKTWPLPLIYLYSDLYPFCPTKIVIDRWQAFHITPRGIGLANYWQQSGPGLIPRLCLLYVRCVCWFSTLLWDLYWASPVVPSLQKTTLIWFDFVATFLVFPLLSSSGL